MVANPCCSSRRDQKCLTGSLNRKCVVKEPGSHVTKCWTVLISRKMCELLQVVVMVTPEFMQIMVLSRVVCKWYFVVGATTQRCVYCLKNVKSKTNFISADPGCCTLCVYLNNWCQ